MTQTVVPDEYKYVKKLDTKRIDELLRSGSIESCGRVLDEVLDEVRFGELRSLVLRLYVVTDIYIAARSFSRELGVSDEEFIRLFGGTDDIESRLGTARVTADFLKDMFSHCIMRRIERSKENGNCVVRNARRFIDENYMKSDLSLNMVASAVGISPTYLSALFKKETGKNLSEYITIVRINKAKELLCCTSKLIYEIAFDVGFQDYRYFSQIFKKCTGQTPKQFQNSANSGADDV